MNKAMAETIADPRSLPLTSLSEDEQMFRDMVRDFAEKELRPRVHQMDQEAKIPPEVVKKCFDLGVMGIEIPESLGGAGS
ncbi:MAG TPA: acyl-CoA dehydrogenase family protein, partial [Vicinamibacteria bacterium]|nr:acyl-CoA dehydrogenase family protein [Vicinamibacteria bacterium]